MVFYKSNAAAIFFQWTNQVDLPAHFLFLCGARD